MSSANDRAEYILYDNGRFRPQLPEENFKALHPPCVLLEAAITSSYDGSDNKIVAKFGVAGRFIVRWCPYDRAIRFDGAVIDCYMDANDIFFRLVYDRFVSDMQYDIWHRPHFGVHILDDFEPPMPIIEVGHRKRVKEKA